MKRIVRILPEDDVTDVGGFGEAPSVRVEDLGGLPVRAQARRGAFVEGAGERAVDELRRNGL